MTVQPSRPAATDADIQSLAEKLQRFSAVLPSGERAVLLDLLGRATAADDIQGFDFAGERYQAMLAAFDPAQGFGAAGRSQGHRSPFLSDIINNPTTQGY